RQLPGRPLRINGDAHPAEGGSRQKDLKKSRLIADKNGHFPAFVRAGFFLHMILQFLYILIKFPVCHLHTVSLYRRFMREFLCKFRQVLSNHVFTPDASSIKRAVWIKRAVLFVYWL